MYTDTLELTMYFGFALMLLIWIVTYPRPYKEAIHEITGRGVSMTAGLMVMSIVISALAAAFIPYNFGRWGTPLSYIGFIVFIAGLGFAIWAKLTMKDVWGPPASYDKRQNKLITTGPFKYSRNPIYVGIIAMCLGFGLGIESLGFVSAFILVFFFMDIIAEEEEILLKVHGKKYEEYKQKVRRFI